MKSAYRFLLTHSQGTNFCRRLAILFAVLAGVTTIAQCYALAFVLDHLFLHHAARNTLLTPLLYFLMLIVLRALLLYVKEITSNEGAEKAKQQLREYYLKKHSEAQTVADAANLSTELIDHIESMHDFFADYLPQISVCCILPLCVLIVFFYQNWLVGLAMLCTAPLIPIFMILIGSKAKTLQANHAQNLSKMNAYFLDRLQGLVTLIFSGRAKAEISKISSISENYRRSTLTILRLVFLSTASLELFATAAIALIAVYLGLGLLGLIHFGFPSTGISLQKALFILLLAPEFFLALRQLGTYYHSRNQALGAAEILMQRFNNT